jgi:hypothetical protein
MRSRNVANAMSRLVLPLAFGPKTMAAFEILGTAFMPVFMRWVDSCVRSDDVEKLNDCSAKNERKF